MLVDLGRETSHHATNADCDVVAVADQDVGRRHLALDPVERDDLLAVTCLADAEATALELREVVRVVRLPELEHHVVRDVDDVVDRAHARARQPVGHPGGRLGHPHAGDHARGEPPASLLVDDRHVDTGRWARDLDRGIGQRQRHARAERRGHARHPHASRRRGGCGSGRGRTRRRRRPRARPTAASRAGGRAGG